MKNNVLWIFLVICVLIIGFLAGYLVAMQNPGRAILTDNGLRKNSSQAIGSYKSDSWNGGSAALVLKNVLAYIQLVLMVRGHRKTKK